MTEKFWESRGIGRPRPVLAREGSRSLSVVDPRARLLTVRADLCCPVVVHPLWGIMLDAVLLAVAWRRQNTAHPTEAGAEWVSEPGLPLVRDFSKRWVWAASSSEVIGAAGEDVHWRHRRSRITPMLTRTVRVPSSPEEGGRYRGMRMPVVTTACQGLAWRAVGDPDGVRDLLGDVIGLGDDRSRGEGEVAKWSVQDAGPIPRTAESPHRLDWTGMRAHYLWVEGVISRPVDIRHADELGLSAPETILGTYRPPYWRPMWSQSWASVIAPWTARP